MRWKWSCLGVWVIGWGGPMVQDVSEALCALMTLLGNWAVIPGYSPQWLYLIGWVILVCLYYRILKAEHCLFQLLLCVASLYVWHKTIYLISLIFFFNPHDDLSGTASNLQTLLFIYVLLGYVTWPPVCTGLLCEILRKFKCSIFSTVGHHSCCVGAINHLSPHCDVIYDVTAQPWMPKDTVHVPTT